MSGKMKKILMWILSFSLIMSNISIPVYAGELSKQETTQNMIENEITDDEGTFRR